MMGDYYAEDAGACSLPAFTCSSSVVHHDPSGPGTYADSCLSYANGECGSHTSTPLDAGVSSCASPGEATPGPADTHCTMEVDSAANTPPQPVCPADCCYGADAGEGDGGAESCPYNATMYGHVGDDDDCKYHVTWSSSAICEGAPGVQFVVQATYQTRFTDAGAPLPVVGANVMTEVFTTTPGEEQDAGICDTNSANPPGPTSGNHMIEGPPGTYTANVQFNKSGQWTIRFHFNEECADVADDSPHGHAAFHITVP
jgi:hypothetical protein